MGWLGRAALAALAIGIAGQAQAADIKLLCIPGLRAALAELLPQFERDSGNKVVFHYEIYPGQKQQIESGDFDVAIFATPQIDDLTKAGKLVAGTVTNLARTSIGVAVKSGAPKPDISSDEAFKKTLLAAKSITYTKQSQTGVFLTKKLETLGLAEALKDKLQLQPGGAMTTVAVAKGEAELGIVLVSDILATPGVDLVGPVPASFQHTVMQTAALNATAKQPAAGEALIKYLASPAAGAVFKAKGLEPAVR
jgi:molybdate transport system substrate-binding protein